MSQTVRVEVRKKGTESTTSLIRRFTRRVNDTGMVRKLKGDRFFTRPLSELAKKAKALRRISRREEFTRLYKLGKIDVKRKGRR
ncbi:MAG: 30S ribosomal protein S21 [bacterium]|nr:30S ribosomal protein S21 [bacterium]